MSVSPATILLVEDDPADARLIQEALADTADSRFRVESVTQVSDALERLGRGAIDVVLLDLASVLEALKAMGVQLAIDDFGTGYSSQSYLQRFPIDSLRIAQSFVRDIGTNSDGATIIGAAIGMGRNLRQRVVAESSFAEAFTLLLEDGKD